ncbi:hypothetical protein VTJ04DRAFT_3069 [Mycothermus thermophilus]|uniref:uncharacterized protein n=1 Tax=Humicola insolens TaxID=85995 RepID=UPI003742D105
MPHTAGWLRGDAWVLTRLFALSLSLLSLCSQLDPSTPLKTNIHLHASHFPATLRPSPVVLVNWRVAFAGSLASISRGRAKNRYSSPMWT